MAAALSQDGDWERQLGAKRSEAGSGAGSVGKGLVVEEKACLLGGGVGGSRARKQAGSEAGAVDKGPHTADRISISSFDDLDT